VGTCEALTRGEEGCIGPQGEPRHIQARPVSSHGVLYWQQKRTPANSRLSPCTASTLSAVHPSSLLPVEASCCPSNAAHVLSCADSLPLHCMMTRWCHCILTTTNQHRADA